MMESIYKMNIYDVFHKLNIDYTEIEHKAVFTVEEAIEEDIPNKIEGIECKNLFVKSKQHYYLVFMEAKKKANLKELALLTNEKKLRFASEEELKNILGLSRGSVTPLGIIHDKDNLVILLIDKELIGNKVLVHPNINTKTVSLELEDLILIIEYFGHKYLTF